MNRTQGRRVGWFAYVLVTTTYLVWRATYTINQDAAVYSWLFLLCESGAFVSGSLFYLITLERRDPPRPRATRDHSVDVFVCSYNEPLDLVRQTIRAALAVKLPHKTWLLDDGHREEARALADELGCGYISRMENTHYKAGNLNNALAMTDGELVVVLDADHLLKPDCLECLVGHFDDPLVALVQTPQVYYNVDSFQHHFQPSSMTIWHEGAIFHHAIQPGANRWGAAMFVGTGAMLRRSALTRVGGFAVDSVTEDILTSMRLHAAGYRSVYVNRPAGYLLAPESLSQYMTQRLRWGQGSMQVLRRENPLFKRGLNFRQRLVYFNSLSSYGQALVHLMYYVAPALYLFGGPAPLAIGQVPAFLPIAGHIALDLVMFKLWLGPLARPLLAECYKFLNLYPSLKALTAYVTPGRKLRFVVTTKGQDRARSYGLLAPHFALLMIHVTAFGFGALRLFYEIGTTLSVLGYFAAAFFCGVFIVVETMTLLFSVSRISSRAHYSFPERLQVTLRASDGSQNRGVVVRLNSTLALALLPDKSIPDRSREQVEMRLALMNGTEIVTQGRVVRQEQTPAGCLLGIALVELEDHQRDQLSDRFIEHSIPTLIDDLIAAWLDSASGRRGERRDDYYVDIHENVV